MKQREYHFHDKSKWGAGAWQYEPDKIQWLDSATGLPCLIVRNRMGALCGYVGVSDIHPLHGLGYNDCLHEDKCPDRTGDSTWCNHTPENLLGAHGGITFAESCSPMDSEAWAKWRERFERSKKEEKLYPHGDSAEFIRVWKDVIDDFPAWQKQAEEQFICHTVEPGEPDNVWWFGFDCAHAGDLMPREREYTRYGDKKLQQGLAKIHERDVYRDVEYVKKECANLAKQLADMVL